jgi:N-acetylmuramoyl-L-alanine amidase
MLFVSSLGCEKAPKARPSSFETRTSPSSGTEEARLRSVQHADDLAVEAARIGGAAGAKLRHEAARIRSALWRARGKEADGLEAVELLQSAASEPWDGACDAAVDQALLEGERAADPTELHASLSGLRERHEAEACRERIDRALAILSAFEPEPSSSDEQTRGTGAGQGPGIGGQAPSPNIVLPQVDAAQSKAATITRIEQYAGRDSARVVVFVTHPTVFELGSLDAEGDRGPRLFVDIRSARYSGQWSLPGEGLVQGVRVGKRPDGTRVVLDLEAGADKRVFYLPEPFRLVIDVARKGAMALRDEGPRTVRRVVLDPGHGGHDPGATGPLGLREKDVALDIAHRAAPLLARELGISTLLTRDIDVFVPLDERVARANAFGADLFISIHCNASESGVTRGVTTFVLDASGDAMAARVAARENAASPGAAVELTNALSRVLDEDVTARSTHFAQLLQRSAMASLGPRYPGSDDLGVRRAGFYVLAGARMPAVLFETSFISHIEEERRLDSPDYRQKLADAIVNAVRALREGI